MCCSIRKADEAWDEAALTDGLPAPKIVQKAHL